MEEFDVTHPAFEADDELTPVEADDELTPESFEAQVREEAARKSSPVQKSYRSYQNRSGIPDLIDPADISPELRSRFSRLRQTIIPDAVRPKSHRKGGGKPRHMSARDQLMNVMKRHVERDPEVAKQDELKRARRDVRAMTVPQLHNYLASASPHDQQVLLFAEKKTRNRQQIMAHWHLSSDYEERYEEAWVQISS
jgi:hypothetical protein